MNDQRVRTEATRVLRNVLLMYKSIAEHVRALEVLLGGPVPHAIIAKLAAKTHLDDLERVTLEDLLEEISKGAL